MRKKVFLLLACILLIMNGFTQEAFNKERHQLGFVSGYGNQQSLGVKYTYEVVFFQFQHYYRLSKNSKWQIDLLTQPQFNTVKFKPIDTVPQMESGIEFGINVGFLFRRQIVNEKVHFYTFISSGPHYVSGTPARQVSGFIFSDNFFVGMDFQISPQLRLDIRPGFRHISNASIKQPNKGVNTVILSGGFILKLEKYKNKVGKFS